MKYNVGQTVYLNDPQSLAHGRSGIVTEIKISPKCHPYRVDFGVHHAYHPESELLESAPIAASDYEITSGYVGGMGKSYKTATDQALSETIAAAATFNSTTAENIQKQLESGAAVNWCESPNFYYDHSYGVIRRKRSTQPEKNVKCDCGHWVSASQRMAASMGSSCPDCYDRMSN